MGISAAAREKIQGRLDALEREHGVRVLYACESGSRAWGFASPDSDYDVRIVYVHPRDWYLSIDLERRDDAIDPELVDTPVGEVDLHAWDIRKALGLFRKSNPPLLEWLQSPIVYREDAAVMDEWRALIPAYYRPEAAAYHYLHMAQKNVRRYLRDADAVPLKKYLYVLRPLLALRWIDADRGPVPTAFAHLVDATVDDPELRAAIGRLLDRKRQSGEMDTAPPLPVLHPFALRETQRWEEAPFAQTPSHPDLEPLNDLFRHVLLAA